MENAADALKIGFAIFVFVVAITVTFSVVSQAKSTADVVLFYSDKTNFYDHTNSSQFNRKVRVKDIISTLYRCYDESISVTIIIGSNEYVFESLRDTIINEDGNITNKISLNSPEDRENNLKNFINKVLLSKYEDAEFTEEFVEVPLRGIYEKGEDDTEIALSDSGKTVYITYTLD